MAARRPAVFDCSAIVPWFLEDEANDWSEALLDRLPEFDIHVPALWHLEFPNVLLGAERRGRIDAASRVGMVELAARLPLTTDRHVVSLGEISRLAAALGLTTYDAAYLELAQRLGGRLATQDRALIAAAKRLRVGLLAP